MIPRTKEKNQCSSAFKSKDVVNMELYLTKEEVTTNGCVIGARMVILIRDLMGQHAAKVRKIVN